MTLYGGVVVVGGGGGGSVGGSVNRHAATTTAAGGDWYGSFCLFLHAHSNSNFQCFANKPIIPKFRNIKPHTHTQQVSAFQAYGEAVNGTIEEGERSDVIRNACPGAGACGGMYTANTMASAIEAMGMSLPGSSSAPADSQEKRDECTNIGPAL